jgi:hypothetical protein
VFALLVAVHYCSSATTVGQVTVQNHCVANLAESDRISVQCQSIAWKVLTVHEAIGAALFDLRDSLSCLRHTDQCIKS